MSSDKKIDFKVGIIGCGYMGGAIAIALFRSQVLGDRVNSLKICGYDLSPEKLLSLEEKAEIISLHSAADVVKQADFIFLCVKPKGILKLIKEISDHLTADKVLISVAAGVLEADMCLAADNKCPVVRVMPTATALVGLGLFALTLENEKLDLKRKDLLRFLVGRMGKVYEMPEQEINTFTAVAGCGPGIIFYLLQSMVEGAVALGVPRAMADEIVITTAKASALIAEESKESCTTHYERVASPGGMTIEAGLHLDRTGSRGHIADAIKAAYLKGIELSKK